MTTRHQDEVRRFYDEWSARFVAGFGTTFQAGLLKDGENGREDPAMSTLMLAARAGVQPGQRVLDAGCGVGGPAVAIANGFADVVVHGLTISAVQADLGRRLVADEGLSGRVAITEADYHRLPFADDSFDIAVFFESTGYSPDRRALFAEAARVVRRDGFIYVKDVFARAGPLTNDEQRDLRAFDRLWHLAASPTIPEVEGALHCAGCEILTSGELANVGTASFLRAMVEPDPETLFRLSELGKAFKLQADTLPTFFGEVVARVLV